MTPSPTRTAIIRMVALSMLSWTGPPCRWVSRRFVADILGRGEGTVSTSGFCACQTHFFTPEDIEATEFHSGINTPMQAGSYAEMNAVLKRPDVGRHFRLTIWHRRPQRSGRKQHRKPFHTLSRDSTKAQGWDNQIATKSDSIFPMTANTEPQNGCNSETGAPDLTPNAGSRSVRIYYELLHVRSWTARIGPGVGMISDRRASAPSLGGAGYFNQREGFRLVCPFAGTKRASVAPQYDPRWKFVPR